MDIGVGFQQEELIWTIADKRIRSIGFTMRIMKWGTSRPCGTKQYAGPIACSESVREAILSVMCDMRYAKCEVRCAKCETASYQYLHNLLKGRCSSQSVTLFSTPAKTVFPSQSFKHFKMVNAWSYKPSPVAAIIFFVLFTIATLWHIVIIFRRRTWYFTPLAIGGICMI